MRKFTKAYNVSESEAEKYTVLNTEDLKDLIKVTVEDEDAKSVCICCDNCEDAAVQMSEFFDSYIEENDADDDIIEVDGADLEDSIDDLFDMDQTPSVIFVRNADEADTAALKTAGVEFKVIALCACGHGEDCPLFDKLGEDYEYFICDDTAVSNDAEVGTDIDNIDISEQPFESVATKFAKYSSLYESLNEDDNEDSEDNNNDEDADKDDKKDNNDKDEKKDDDDVEDIDVSAVVITVKKDDVDKCKEELIDAGVSEKDIDVLDDEDEDSENVDIKVDVNSIIEVKNWIEKKKGDGAFKELTGVEIVDDEDSDDDKDADGEKDDKKKEDNDSDTEFIDDDFDFGDIFNVDAE